MKYLEQFRDLSWNIDKPMSAIKKWNRDTSEHESAKDVLKQKVNIKKGDRIVILRYDQDGKEIPVLTELVRGKTVESVMKSLHRGLNRYLKSGNRGYGNTGKGEYYFEKNQKYPFPEKNEVVYHKISGYFDTNNRLDVVIKFEKGTLKPYELYGDHKYFEGFRRKGNLLYFVVGS